MIQGIEILDKYWFTRYSVFCIYVPVKSKLQHPPPRATPRAFEFLENFFQIPPSPGQKGDQMPPPPGKLLNNSAQRISSFTGT